MFCPNGITGSINVTTTSQVVDISSADPNGGVLRLVGNTTPNSAIKFGDASVVAVYNDDLRISEGETLFRIPAGATHFAIISTTTNRVHYALGVDF